MFSAVAVGAGVEVDGCVLVAVGGKVNVTVAGTAKVGVEGAGRVVGDMQLTRGVMVMISTREKNTRRVSFVFRKLNFESLLYTMIMSSTHEFVKPKQFSTDY